MHHGGVQSEPNMNIPPLWRRIGFTACMFGAAIIFVWFDSLAMLAFGLAAVGCYFASTFEERKQFEELNRKLPVFQGMAFVLMFFGVLFMSYIYFKPLGDLDSVAGHLFFRILAWLGALSMIWFAINQWRNWLDPVQQDSARTL